MMAEAFKLMMTGMGTVFVILILVVLLGHLIILVTNKLNQQVVPVVVTTNQNISSPKMAAIITAVEVATQGKGNIASIKKIDER